MEAQDLQKWCFCHHFQHCPYVLLLRIREKPRHTEASSICQPDCPHNHRPKECQTLEQAAQRGGGVTIPGGV